MNKTVTINIAGLFFHIDEDAYNKLSNYLNAIKNSLNTEGKEEIIKDIESRIAEIFNEKINPTVGVINMTDVDQVIQMMGQPEDYRLDDENSENTNYQQTYTTEENRNKTRKLFRDGDKGILGGVLSGLSNYFNVDVVWIRIIFILLIFAYGMSIIIYPILWIIIPKAKTVSDILEMKGEPVNISNIEKVVRDNMNQLGDNLKNFDSQRIKQVGTTAGEIIRKVLGVVCIFFGITGMMGAFITLFALNTVSNAKLKGFPMEEIINIGYPSWSIVISLFLMILIPFLIMFIIGLKCFYKNMKYISLVSILLGFFWAISVVFFSAVMIQVESKKEILNKIIHDNNKITVVKKSLDHIKNDTLNIEFVRDPRFYGINDTLTYEEMYIEEDDINLEIKPTSKKEPYFEVVTEASYSKSSSFIINNNSGNVTFTETPTMLDFYSNINGNTIEFATAILNKKINSEDFNNSVKILLYLPHNKIIRINSDHQNFIDYRNRIEPGIKYYKLNHDELVCTNCN